MFLKIQMNDFTKKIKFSEKYQNFSVFMTMIEDVISQDLVGLKVFFFDQENDKVFIEDEFDLEYLIENSKKKQFQDIFIEKVVKDQEEQIESKVEEETKEETQPAEFIEISKLDDNDYVPQIQSEIKQEEFEVKDETNDNVEEKIEEMVESKLITEVEQPEEIIEDKSIEVIENQETTEEAKEESVEEVKEELVEEVKEEPVEEVKEEIMEEQNPEESFKIENDDNQSQPDSILAMSQTLSLMQSQIEKLTNKMEKMEKKKEEKKKRKCMKKKCRRNKKHDFPEVEIVVEDQSNQNNKVHQFVTCDGCKMYPLVGNRFKCLDCPDYDLCQECAIKDEHPHNMIQIKNKLQRNGLMKIHKIYNRIKNHPRGQFPFDHIVESLGKALPPFFRGPHCRRMKREERRQEKMRSLDRKMNEEMIREKLDIMTFVLGEATDEQKIKNRNEFVEKNVTMELEDFHNIMLEKKEEF